MIRQVTTALGIAVSLAIASPLYAQNPNSQKPKKQANQVPETGQNDPAPATDDTFERVVANVPVSVRADGTLVAELDDTFMEATTVSIGANGVLHYEHFSGLKHASFAVQGLQANGMLRTRALRLPYVPYAGHEEKE